jgi:ribosomal-protein-alanine N-acetyltransferase
MTPVQDRLKDRVAIITMATPAEGRVVPASADLAAVEQQVMQIEQASFEFPWTEEEFIRCLRQRDCIGMVAERNEEVVGFMIYELHKTRIHILSFAVHPEFRREGVGKAMTEKLVSKLAYQRRNRIVLEVRETNLSAQLFFRQLGFRATGVLKDFYEDTPEDAFLMQFRQTAEEAMGVESNKRFAG